MNNLYTSKVLAYIFPSLKTTKDITLEKLPPRRKLSNNFMRNHLIGILEANLLNRFTTSELNVAIVGGSYGEPEIELLRELGFRIQFKTFGIELADIQMDLNYFTPDLREEKFDLILCSQVLEHVWNHGAAFSNLKHLLKDSGIIWITCPYSNRFHGSPDFYVSGFTPQYLGNQLEMIGLETLKYGSIGSCRNYLATYLLPVWLTDKGHKSPILFAFEERNILLRFAFSIRYLPRTIFLSFQSPRVTSFPETSTDTWLLARLK